MDLGVDYIIEAGIKADCDIECITKALLIYHNFMRYVENTPYDPAMVAASALHLSSKAVEKVVDVDGLIFLFYHMVNGTVDNLYPGTMKFKVLKKSLITVVYIMQRMLVFNLQYNIAHQYLVPFLYALHTRSRNIHGFLEIMSDTSMKFINDFYTNKMCLNYKPADICVACIDTALHVHEFVFHLETFHPWFHGFSDMTEEKANKMKRKLLRLYKDEDKEMPSVDKDKAMPPVDKDKEMPSVDKDKLPSLLEKDNGMGKE